MLVNGVSAGRGATASSVARVNMTAAAASATASAAVATKVAVVQACSILRFKDSTPED